MLLKFCNKRFLVLSGESRSGETLSKAGVLLESSREVFQGLCSVFESRGLNRRSVLCLVDSSAYGSNCSRSRLRQPPNTPLKDFCEWTTYQSSSIGSVDAVQGDWRLHILTCCRSSVASEDRTRGNWHARSGRPCRLGDYAS